MNQTAISKTLLTIWPGLNDYAAMLGERISRYGTSVFLVNTGWAGGKYGVGERMKLRYTRAMVTAALNGELDKGEFKTDPVFGVSVPTACPNVPAEFLDQRTMWADKAEYEKTAHELALKFVENFSKYKNMPQAVIDAGPKA